MDLGVNVLKLPEYTINAALYDKREIQSAAHKVLRTWMKKQTDRREAYTTLHNQLRKAKLNQLAVLMKQSAECSSESSQITNERTYVIFYGVFTRCIFQPVINNAAFYNYHCTDSDSVKNTQNWRQTHSVRFNTITIVY